MFESSLREIKMISGNEYSTLSAGINFGSEASLQLPVELGMASRYEGRSQSGFGKVWYSDFRDLGPIDSVLGGGKLLVSCPLPVAGQVKITNVQNRENLNR